MGKSSCWVPEVSYVGQITGMPTSQGKFCENNNQDLTRVEVPWFKLHFDECQIAYRLETEVALQVRRPAFVGLGGARARWKDKFVPSRPLNQTSFPVVAAFLPQFVTISLLVEF